MMPMPDKNVESVPLTVERYRSELDRLQREMVALQEWVAAEKLKMVVLFEGRDAAGKGGVIKRMIFRLNPRVCRVVALSGGYDRMDSTRRLRTCRGVSASFSRALTEGLRVDMTDEEFDAALGASIGAIYEAACT